MPQTFRDRPLLEVAISTRSLSPTSGGERVQQGDIASVRKPLYAVGRLEVRDYLWIYLQGPDWNECVRLHEGGGVQIGQVDEILYEKRRYGIPFSRLQQMLPSFSESRAADRRDAYQPFCNGVDLDFPDYVNFEEALQILIHARGQSDAEAWQNLEVSLIPAHHRARGKTLTHRMMQHSLHNLRLYDWGDTFKPQPRPNTGGVILSPRRAYPVEGLVFDKARQRFVSGLIDG
jgi:hypothetical protein